MKTAVLLLGLLLTALSARAAGTISGQVTDAVTTLPLDGSVVTWTGIER